MRIYFVHYMCSLVAGHRCCEVCDKRGNCFRIGRNVLSALTASSTNTNNHRLLIGQAEIHRFPSGIRINLFSMVCIPYAIIYIGKYYVCCTGQSIGLAIKIAKAALLTVPSPLNLSRNLPQHRLLQGCYNGTHQ